MNNNYKYIIFSPYFGTLPNNFKLWLNSCSYNRDFKFIVFTDDMTKYNLPENVEIVYLSFDNFANCIQKKFDFKINLNKPYKLCDFKPTYGFVFDKYVENYEYWGYCDIDLIFGDLAKFLPIDINKYEKISYLGHFCMYKNNKKINELFMSPVKNTISYIDILSSEQHFGFDEIGTYGINNIFRINNCNIYDYQINVADVTCRKENFRVSKYQNNKFTREKYNRIFVFDEGKIISMYIENGNLKEKEYAYLHFQKRKMSNQVKNYSKYIIKYNGFIDYFNVNKDNLNNLLFPWYKLDLKWIKIKIMGIRRRLKKKKEIKRILDMKGK